MPDKWAQYAQAPQSGGDKWAQYATPTGGDADGEDSRFGFQKSFDENTQTNPKEPLMETGLKSVVGGAGGMFVHPWETAKGMASGLVHGMNPGDPENPAAKMAAGAKQDYQEGGLPYALTKTAGNLFGNVAGGAALGEVAGLAGETAGNVMAKIPTHAKAGAIFQDLNTKLANQPVNLTQSTPELTRLEKIGAAGPGVPTTVGKLLDRSRMIKPMNYPEARLFQENLSGPSTTEKMGMGGSMKGGVKQLNKAFYGDIQNAADAQGLGEDYAKGMKMYRQASTARDIAKKLGKAAAYGAAGAAGVGAGARLVKDLTQ